MTRSGCLALVLVAVLLGGCSLVGAAKSPVPPKTVSKARFEYLVRRATRQMVCGGIQHGKPTTFAQVKANLKKDVAAYERFLFTLRGIAPPQSVAVSFKHLLGAMDRLDLLFNGLSDAVNAADLPRIKALLKRMHRLTARFDRQFHVNHRTDRHLRCATK